MTRSFWPIQTVARFRDRRYRVRRFFAVASGGAFLTVLAWAQPSQAYVVHRPINITYLGNQAFPVDVNGDGVADLAIDQYTTGDVRAGCFTAVVNETPSTNNGVVATQNTGWVLGLPARTTLGRYRVYYLKPNALLAAYGHYSGGRRCSTQNYSYGYWTNSGNHYLGLKFNINGQAHFGYAVISVNIFVSPVNHSWVVSTFVTEYAYETVPNTAIITGN